MSFIAGVIGLTNTLLAVAAGILALTLFKSAHKKLAAWKPLIIVLVLFAIEMILGILKAFHIYSTPHLTHIVPSILLGFLIYALVRQIYITGGKV